MPSEKEDELFEPLVELIQFARRTVTRCALCFLEDLIDACVMECYFRDHMAERDLLFHVSSVRCSRAAMSKPPTKSSANSCTISMRRLTLLRTESATSSSASPSIAQIFSPSSNRREQYEDTSATDRNPELQSISKFELDLDGKHLLVYSGLMAPGKSSLYWALHCFLQSAP